MENSEAEDYLDTIDDSSEESVDSLVNEADSEEVDTEDWDATDEDSDDEESEEASDEDEDTIDDDESATPQAPIVSMETLPITGEARVDDALGRLADLQGLPVHEHVAVFEDVQRRLHETLADLAGQ